MKYLVGLSILFIFLLPYNVFGACNADGFTVVYINGVFTSNISDAENDKVNLQNNFKRIFGIKNVKFLTGYNPSHLAGAGDLIESASQLFDSSISNYDHNTILLQLHPEITTRKILLVGHSQGTFYTNEIYNYLLANGEQKEAVGVYNVATPASYVSGNGIHITSENDKVINSVRNIAAKVKAKQPLPANIAIPLSSQEAADSFGGHSFSGVYLSGASGRIVSEINDSLKKLSAASNIELSAEKSSDTTDVGCFTPPQRSISYYTQKIAFAVTDTAATGVVAASNGVVIAGKTAYNGALVFGQSIIKIAENVYTNIENSANTALSKGSALIANSFANSEQSNNNTAVTDDNSENQDTTNNNQAEEENLSQVVSDTSVDAGNEFPATSQETSTSLRTNTADIDGVASSTAKSESDNPQSDNLNLESTTSTNSTSSPQASSTQSDSGQAGQATTTQNNNVSGGGGGNVPLTGGVSVVQTSLISVQQVSLAITEIMYDASGTDSGHEWVEIFNNGTSSADITKLKFFESGTNHNLNTAQESSTLAPGSYAALADYSSKFLSDYPTYSGQLFDSSFSLSNNSETIAIKNGDTIINEVTYSSSTGANGDGNSLQLISGLWQATSPTPGKENKISNKPPIALFKFSPASPKASDTISFDASSSTDPDGNIVSYSWNFGDGQSTTTNQATTTYSYGSVGSYLVELTPFDNSGASSTATSTISVASSFDSNVSSSSPTSSESNHIVISEILFNASGTDVGKEFIELYNPSATSTDLSGWSLKYQKENSASTTSLALFKASSNPEDQTVIQPKGFLLIGLNNYDSLNYGGKSADIKRIASLPNGEVSDQPEKIYIILLNNSSSEIDKINYDKNSIISDGQSLERKASQNEVCVSSENSGEFLGNGCDTNGADDFEIRTSPNPQNSGNLPEPRNAPTINNFQVTYNFAPRLDFSWDLSSDSTGATSTVSYSVYDTSATGSTSSPQASSILILETASATSTIATSTTYSVNEVGRNYNFQFSVKDRDGLSNSTTTTVLANSFLDKFYFYSSAPTSTNYFFDITTTSSRPFWSATDSGGYGGWTAIVFYLNKDAPKQWELSTDNNLVPSDNSYVRVGYSGCGGYGGSDSELIFPWNSASCVQGSSLSSGAYDFSKLEDLRLTVGVSGSNPGIPFSSNDYVTLAFYDFGGGGGNSQRLHLAAVDKTKYYFKDTPQNQNTPATLGNFSANFATSTGILNLSWSSSTDADTLDYLINYQVNYSTSSVLNDLDWQAVGTSLSASTIPVYPNSYKVGVRAVDSFNNTSTPAVVDWNFPSGFVQLPSQLNHENIISTTNGAQKFFVSYSASISAVALFVGQDSDGQHGYSQSYIEIRKDKEDLADALVATSIPNTIGKDDAQGELIYVFDTPVQLEASSSYWIVAVRGPATTSGTKYYGSISNPYPGGYWSNNTNTAYDIYFRLVQ